MAALKSSRRSGRSARSRTLDRSLLLGGILALWMVGLIARLYYLQVVQYGDLEGRAQRQQQHTVEVSPNRGTIFDRNLHPLAMSVAVDSIYAVPAEIPDRAMVAKVIAPILGLEAADLLGRFNVFRSFCWVKRKVSDREAERVRQLDLKGIYFQKETKRFYPKGELAAQVLGYVGVDDKGLAGLEYEMNEAIAGLPARILLASDAHHQSFLSSEGRRQPGKNVVLTLDENIQYIAEKALDEAVRKWQAAGGVVIVQNPNTGEVLAMASAPSLDANDYVKSRAQARVNRGVSWVYEPGSTFKVVTVSAALEEHLTRPNELIDCQRGRIVLAHHTIHDHKPFGLLTLSDIVAESSDVGAIKLGLRLGEERLYHYIRSFGFGERKDVQLPGEERGLLRPPSHWSGISIGAISMGQEVGVTPLQLLTAYSAIANGGILFQPRIVQDVFRGDERHSVLPSDGRRVVSQRTAGLMKRMLAGVVEHGTGLAARLRGYSAGGKTGTAQKIDATGRYSRSHYIASFVGFAPVERPAVTILVVIDSPAEAIYGAEVAAPAFRSIAEQTLSYLRVPQDDPSRLPQLAMSSPARSTRQAQGDTAGSSLLESESSDSAASSLEPSTVQPVSFKGQPASTLHPSAPEGSSPSHGAWGSGTVVLDQSPITVVPDFSGLAVRRVAEECQELGLELTVRGSGLAEQQSPAAGSRVPAGTGITVRFGR